MQFNKKKILMIGCLTLLLVSAVFLFSGATKAQTLDEGLVEIQEITEYSSQDLIVTIAKIIRVVLGFVGLIALILFIYAGIVWMTSKGDPQRIELAKKIMISVAIGMLIIVTAFAITTFIIKRLEDIVGGGPGAGQICITGEAYPEPATLEEECSYCNEAGNGYKCNKLATTLAGDSCDPICNAPDLFRVRAVYPIKDSTNNPTCAFAYAKFNMLVDGTTIDGQFQVTVDMEAVGGVAGRQIDEAECTDNRECKSGECIPNPDFPAVPPAPVEPEKICNGNTVVGTLGVDENMIIWERENKFFKNTQYKILITENVLSTGDKPGLSLLSGGGSEKEWIFTTGSDGLPNPPTIVFGDPPVPHVDPVNGEVDVCLEASLDIGFSQEMDLRTLREAGAITMDTAAPLDDDFLGYTINVGGDLKSASAYPRNLYNTRTTYTPKLDSTIIKDICGNPLDGNANGEKDVPLPPAPPPDDYPNPDNPWSFTTGGVDRKACPPEIDSVTAEGYYDTGAITITGKYLGLDGEVIFNRQVVQGNSCLNDCGVDPICNFPASPCVLAGDWTNTQITLNIPAARGDGGYSSQTNGAVTGEVRVKRTIDFKNEENVRLSDRGTITIPSPYIKSISPKEGPVGQYVTIYGMNFGSEEGVVRWIKNDKTGPVVEAEFPPAPCPKTWTDTRIIIKVNPGLALENYYLQVKTADYRPVGEPPHLSNVESFIVTNGTPGPGICDVVPECSRIGALYPVGHDLEGQPIPVVINGERFGAAPGKATFDDAAAVIADAADWTDILIDTVVPDGVTRGYNMIVVEDAAGNPSNPWDFRIPCPLGESCDPNPLTATCEAGGVCSGDRVCGSACTCSDAPKIARQQLCPIISPPALIYNTPSPAPDSTDNCIYSIITVIFDQAMDNLDEKDNYELLKCNTGGVIDCSAGVVQDIMAQILMGSFGRGSRIFLEPDVFSHAFEKNTWYRVKVKNTNEVDSALRLESNPAGIPLKEPYTWDFKTANSTACPVREVGVRPVDGEALIVGAGNTEVFAATPFPEHCNYVFEEDLNYDLGWSTGDLGIATVLEDPADQLKAKATGVIGGITDIIARDTISLNSGSAELTVNACTNHNHCNIHWSDGGNCAALDLGGAGSGCCEESLCHDTLKICSPDITFMQPGSGAEGTWTTINGCWFGTEPGEIMFKDVGFVPLSWIDPSIARPDDCVDVWSNNQVIAQIPEWPPAVPDRVKQGSLRADYGADDLWTVSNDAQALFDVDSTVVRPGICWLVPPVIEPEQNIDVVGQAFEAAQVVGDTVSFKNSTVFATLYPSWSDVLITVEVPAAARTGVVRVEKFNAIDETSPFLSNPIRLIVITDLPEVQEVTSGCDLGRGIPSPNPKRGAANACINAVVTGRFNMLEINEASIILEDNITLKNLDTDAPVLVTPAVRNYGDVKGFEIRPNANLTPDTEYKVTVENIAIEGQPDLVMLTPYVWEFKTRTDPNPCPVDEILVSPIGAVTYSADGVATIIAPAAQDYRVDGVNQTKCIELTDTVIADWESSNLVAAFVFPAARRTTTRAAGAGLGETDIKATESTEGKLKDSSRLRVLKEPDFTYKWPDHLSVDNCQNTAIEVVFNQLMDESNLIAPAVSLIDEAGAGVAGEILLSTLSVHDSRCSNIGGCTRLIFFPADLLASGANYTFTILNTVESIYGMTLSDDLALSFTVGADICPVDSVEILKVPDLGLNNEDIFMCAGRNDCPLDVDVIINGNQHFYQAVVFDDAVPPHPITDALIIWQVNTKSSIYEYRAGDRDSWSYLTSKKKEGEDYFGVEVENNPEWGLGLSQATTTIKITNWFCETPWPEIGEFPYKDSVSNCSNLGDADCIDFNFLTFYCRDDGLPELTTTPIVKKFDPLEDNPVQEDSQPAQTEDLLKEFIFSLDRSDEQGKDVLGFRIFNNSEHLSAASWYKGQGKEGALKSAGSADGYPAAQEGRAIYLTASSDNPSLVPPTIFTNTYLLSYNQDAENQTTEILGQLIENWRFNTNVPDIKDKEGLVRDTKRLIDFSEMSDDLESYKLLYGNYPNLRAGSFIKTYSVSKWPSWTKELGSEIKASFVDPLNTFNDNCPEGHDQETCWNEGAGTFVCPEGSHVYTYQSGGLGFKIASDFEYDKYDIGAEESEDFGWNNLDTNKFQINDVCTDKVYGSGGVCGDGIFNPAAEVCEQGDTSYYCQRVFHGGPYHNELIQTCNSDCTGWVPVGGDIASCGGFCGNLVHNPPVEQCDASSGVGSKDYANSSYNQYLCGSDCKWSTGGWCGDRIIQGVHGEVCDGNIRTEGCTLLGGHPGIKIQECKSDCKSFGGLGNCVTPEKCGDGIKNGTEETCDEGPFNGGPLCRDDCTKCGDGKLQGWHDEVCDDNNNLMDDGCNASCELEPFNFTTPVPDTETIYLADVGDYTYNVDVSTEGDNDNIRYGLIISPVPVAPMFSINETNGTISNISTAGDGTFEINIIAYDRFLGAMSDPDLMVAGSVQQIMTKKQTFSLTVLRCGDGAIQVCSDLAISDPALCVGDLVLLEQCDDSNSNSGDGCDACLLEPFDINPSGLTEVFIDEPTWAGQTFTLTFPALGANWQISSLPDWLELTVVSADEALLDFDTVSYLVIPDDIPIPELVNSFGSVTITVADIIGGAEISATKTFDLRTLLAKYMIYGMVTNPMIPGQPPVEGAILVLTDETGAVVQTVTTNVGGPNPGKYEFLDVPHRESPENYTIDASGPVAGYTPVHDAGLSGTGFELTSDVEKNYVMWVGLGAENNTIVLKWGDLPADLDAHIYYNGGGHIYHRNKNIGGDISLDLDNTYQKGPETITIDSLFSDFTYTYVVRNYGNPSERRIPASYPPEEKTCPDDPTGNVYECECCEAGTCNSKPDFEDARDGGLSVEVYNPGNLLIKVFEINEFTTGEFKSCNWEVFSIDGATGEITEINKLQCEPSRKCEWDGSGEACVGTFRHYSSSASCTNASDCNVRYGCNWSTGVCGAKSSGWDLGTCEANCVINIMCRRSNGTCYAAPGTPSYGNPEACTAVCQEETYFRCHSGGCSKWTCNDPVNCLGNCECDNLDDCTGVTSCPDCGACPGDPPPGPSCPANCGCPNEDACPYGCDSTCGK